MPNPPKITIDELEAKYPLYCKALKGYTDHTQAAGEGGPGH